MVRLTKDQALVISAYTGTLTGISLDDIVVYAENKLGKFIDPFEFRFANIWEELRTAVKNDFIAVCYKRNIKTCGICGRELFSEDCWRCGKQDWRTA